MDAAEIMNRQVITVPLGTSLAEAVRLMLQKGISGLPVVGANGEMAGIITEGDLMRRAELGTRKTRPAWIEFLRGPGRQADDFVRTHARKVDEVMTSDVITVSEDTPAVDVVALMEQHRIKRVPVTRGGKPVGIVSRADLLAVLGRILAAGEGVSASDDQIREGLIALLEKQGWVPRAGLQITVNAGTVTLEGVIYDDRERQALCVAAETVPGVRKVEDHLVWVEPTTGMTIGGDNAQS
jgi:CBS domain-containing protein